MSKKSHLDRKKRLKAIKIKKNKEKSRNEMETCWQLTDKGLELAEAIEEAIGLGEIEKIRELLKEG